MEVENGAPNTIASEGPPIKIPEIFGSSEIMEVEGGALNTIASEGPPIKIPEISESSKIMEVEGSAPNTIASEGPPVEGGAPKIPEISGSSEIVEVERSAPNTIASEGPTVEGGAPNTIASEGPPIKIPEISESSEIMEVENGARNTIASEGPPIKIPEISESSEIMEVEGSATNTIASEGPPVEGGAPNTIASEGLPVEGGAPNTIASEGPPIKIPEISESSEIMEVEGSAPNTIASEGPPVEGGAPNTIASEGPPIKIPGKSSDVLPQITPAIIPTVVPTAIVREVLTEGNYRYWRTCIKRYLVGQGLYEVCRMSYEHPHKGEEPEAYYEWKKKNAMALHAIQISCSREMLSQIMGIKHANKAWDFLKRHAKPTFYFDEPFSGSPEQPPLADPSTGNGDDFSQYEKLWQALHSGSWKDIELFISSNENAVKAKISPTGLTPLHIAAGAGHVKIVANLVEKLSPVDLEEKEYVQGYTALAWAASDGITEIAQCMIRKNSSLANISDMDQILPVVIASSLGKREMTRFLYSHTRSEELAPEKGTNGATLLSYCIASEFLDLALDIIEKHPRLAVTLDMDDLIPLYVLGQMPSLFKRGSQLWFWQRWIYSCISVNPDHASDRVQVNVDDDTARDDRNKTGKVLCQLMLGLSYPLELLGIKNIRQKKLRNAQATKLLQLICTELQSLKTNMIVGYRVHQAVIQAVKRGNVEFVTGMIKSIPELVWNEDINDRNIFFIAILNRQEENLSLLHGLTSVKKKKITSIGDRFDNNMLHLAAMLAPPDKLEGISGAALQMQRELQWYQEVESIVPPICKDTRNSDGKKPSEVFSEQHADLVKEGEKWMKEIANSSTFVSALIVTIMFAAAFTIPGGNNDKGAPIFLENKLFMVFLVSDSISLFSATTSVLMFLGILTSQYAEVKFLTRLPTKLIIGLSTLFVSIAAMMIAFCAALAILLKESSTKVVMIPIILLACVPVTLFALLQFPLLVNIFISTYGPGIFDRKIERWY